MRRNDNCKSNSQHIAQIETQKFSQQHAVILFWYKSVPLKDQLQRRTAVN